MPTTMRSLTRWLLRGTALLTLVALSTSAQGQAVPTLSALEKATLDGISTNSLRGHLSFIASDLLEGRDTPSKGLDLAAEYIAAQFRRAGLEPLGDDGYFQTARWSVVEPDADSFRLAIRIKDQEYTVGVRQISLLGDKE